MRFKKQIGVLFLCLLTLVLAGCGRSSGTSAKMVAMEEASVREAVLVADPEAAVENIYISLEEGWDQSRISSAQLGAWELKELVGIESSAVERCFAYRSDPMQGLADVMLIKPTASADREELRKLLLLYKDRRTSEFENYDILNSFEIARNAVVYDQGDYLILLMLPDNEVGQDIIDQYIPQ